MLQQSNKKYLIEVKIGWINAGRKRRKIFISCEFNNFLTFELFTIFFDVFRWLDDLNYCAHLPPPPHLHPHRRRRRSCFVKMKNLQ